MPTTIPERPSAAFLKAGKPSVTSPIGDMVDEKDWLLNHQNIHDEELAILGLNNIGVDLSEVDLSDEKQFHDWMTEHAYLHQYVNTALGLL